MSNAFAARSRLWIQLAAEALRTGQRMRETESVVDTGNLRTLKAAASIASKSRPHKQPLTMAGIIVAEIAAAFEADV
jgi:hypothetical protein